MSNEDTTLFTRAPDIMMIAGHETTLPFEAVRTDHGEVDLSIPGTVIKWILVDWGMPVYAAQTLTNATAAITVGTPASCFDVHLASNVTYDLCGEYSYQIEIISPAGSVFRPIEGNLIIKPRNYEEA